MAGAVLPKNKEQLKKLVVELSRSSGNVVKYEVEGKEYKLVARAQTTR